MAVYGDDVPDKKAGTVNLYQLKKSDISGCSGSTKRIVVLPVLRVRPGKRRDCLRHRKIFLVECPFWLQALIFGGGKGLAAMWKVAIWKSV